MEQIVNPILFYAAIALGGVGVCLALPRGQRSVQIIGAVLAAAGGGLALLLMGLRSGGGAGGSLPNVYFYIFSLLALGGALRVITHPRPVYSALYFILTILASAGLFLILSAEFMAFALIIVYAGAILITYLFVIMLATQAPVADQVEMLSEYDTVSREPVVATTCGFVLLAALTTLMFGGVKELPAPSGRSPDALLAEMPRKVARELESHGLIEPGQIDAKKPVRVDLAARTATVPLADGGTKTFPLPADLTVKNVESLGFTLLRDHPGSIEIAGVILLMAMLGAVVLSRKQVQIDEDAKMRHAQRLAEAPSGAAAGGAR